MSIKNVAKNGATFITGHGCTGSDTLSNVLSVTVFIEGVEALVSGAISGSHSYGPLGLDPCGAFHSVVYSGGSSTVKVQGISIGRFGDSVDSGSINSGAATVFCS